MIPLRRIRGAKKPHLPAGKPGRFFYAGSSPGESGRAGPFQKMLLLSFGAAWKKKDRNLLGKLFLKRNGAMYREETGTRRFSILPGILC